MNNKGSDQHAGNKLARLKSRLEQLVAGHSGTGEVTSVLQATLVEVNEFIDLFEHGEREWRAAFDAVQDPIFLHDQHYRILRANTAYARLAGMDIRDIIGKLYWQVFPKEDGPLPECTDLLEHNYDAQSTEITLDSGETYLTRGFAVNDARGEYQYSVHILEDVTEQRRLQRAMADNAERYQNLFEGAPDGIFLADAQTGQLLDANPAAECLTGRTREEILKLHQSQLHPPNALAVEDFRNHVNAGLANSSLPPSEMPVLRADGSVVPTEISARVFHLNGRPVIQGVFRDITERKRVEAQAARLGHIIDSSINEIYVFDAASLKFLLVNEGALRNLGYDMAEMSRLTPLDLKPEFTAEKFEALIDALRSDENKVQVFETLHRRKDGSLYPVEVHLQYSAREIPPIFCASILDITERRKADERLRHSEAGLAEAQRLALLGSWEFDIAADHTTWSDEMYRIFELEPGRYGASYEAFLDAIHPDDRERVDHVYRASVETKAPYAITHRLLMPDGRVKYVREMGETHYGEEGQPLRSVGTTQDVTEQHRTEEDLNRSNRALKAISSCNSVLIHATGEDELLNKMCQVIINEGGYRFAWIGMVEDGEAKRVRPVAHAGFEDGYLEQIHITYEDSERGRGPAGCAVRHGEPMVVHDTLTDPDFAPWREAADKCGYRSELALPLKNDSDRVFAVLSIDAAEPHAFDDGALTLMQELARDLAFGVLTLRTRGERDHYLREHEKSDERLKEVLVDTIRAISLTVEKRDPYTAGHQNKVAQLSVAIGRELGMDEDRLEGLRLGAMIHDIGKIYVPAEILNRPGRLSKAEFEIIQSHAEVGYDIVKDVKFPWPVADIVLQHHERIDGTGYPHGLRGEQITIEARIVAVADVVEAITSHRPYRPAVGLDKALMEIEVNRGTRYDAEVADACLHLIRDKGFTFSAVETP